MNFCDDITIIQNFVKGEATLLCNSNLQIETDSEMVKLLSKDKKTIAIIKLIYKNRSAWVQQNSEYWKLLDRILQQNSFVPIGSTEKAGLMVYEQHEIPVGYIMQYTPAINMWKAWFPCQQQAKQSGIQLERLIFLQKKWHLIREINFFEEQFFIKTLLTETVLNSNDNVAWLSKTHQLISDKTLINRKKVQPQSLPEDKVASRVNYTLKPSIAQSDIKSNRIVSEKLSVLPIQGKTCSLYREINENPLQPKSQELLRNPSQETVQKNQLKTDTSIHIDNVLKFAREGQIDSDNTVTKLTDIPELSSVVKLEQGRLYIKTAIGEIIVEGSDYQFRLNPND